MECDQASLICLVEFRGRKEGRKEGQSTEIVYFHFYFLNENASADLVMLSERSGTIQQFMLTVT